MLVRNVIFFFKHAFFTTRTQQKFWWVPSEWLWNFNHQKHTKVRQVTRHIKAKIFKNYQNFIRNSNKSCHMLKVMVKIMFR